MAWDDPAQIAPYDTFKQIKAASRTLPARSCIGFVAQDRLASLIAQAGLAVDHWFGDWTGATFTPQSPEIIPFGWLG